MKSTESFVSSDQSAGRLVSSDDFLGDNHNDVIFSPETVTLPNDIAIEQWKDFGDIPLMHDYNAAINTSRSQEENAEILNSIPAQRILPYLSLELLSDQEKASLINLAKVAIDNADYIHHHQAFFRVTEDYIAGVVHEGESYKNFELADRYCEARKLFCASLLDSFNTSTPDKKTQIQQTFFSSSPDFASYCGDLKDSLELFTISDRTNTNYYSPMDNLRGEIIYTYSFANFNAFDDVLSSEKSPIKQLQLLPVIYDLTKSCSPEDYTSPIIYYASEAFCNLMDSPEASPLVKIVADSFNQRIEDELSTEWAEIDVSDPKYATLAQRDAERRAKIKAEQDDLHHVFPNLPEDQRLVKIAPDMAATINKYNSIELASTMDGRQSSFFEYESDNPLGLDQNTVFLLGFAHNPDVKYLINSKLSLDLSDISLPAQVQLLRFMAEAGDTRFDSLCSTLRDMEKPELRLKLAESFLAADFGDDFGDSLLTIASSESLNDEEKERILDSISSCRESIATITNLYAEIDDGEFAKEYTRAANERLTDAIMAFSQIAENGSATADLGWAGNISLNYDNAIKALEYEMKSLEIISGTFSDVISGVKGAYAERFMSPDESHNRSFYNLFSPNHGYVLLYTRPEGAGEFDPSTEYGKYRNRYSEEDNMGGVEASISMIVDPIEPFELPVPYRPTKKVFRMLGEDKNLITKMMHKVSAIRLDREGRAPNSAPNDTGRNPTNPIGTISVDLAAILDGEDMPSGKIARLFSVGNKIRAEKRGESEFSLNHNTNWFNQDKYGTSDGFSKLVSYLDSQMVALCAIHPPGPKEGMIGRNNRSRGKKALYGSYSFLH